MRVLLALSAADQGADQRRQSAIHVTMRHQGCAPSQSCGRSSHHMHLYVGKKSGSDQPEPRQGYTGPKAIRVLGHELL